MSDWRESAACAGMLNFDQSPRTAAAICKRCEVRAECFETAKADRDFEGMAGGVWWKAQPKPGTERRIRRVA